MQPRRVKFGHEARRKLAEGIEIAYRSVAPTLGPTGRFVLMDSRFGTPEVATSAIDKGFDSPVLGNDGLAIVNEIHIGDTFANQGIALAREAGRMTKRSAGDGSTTAIVLTAALVREGVRLVGAGFEPRRLEAAMGRAVDFALDRLAAGAVEVAGEKAIAEVALRASGSDAEIAEAVASAVSAVGPDDVQIERVRQPGVSVELREGIRLDRGAVSPYLLPAPERSEAVLRDCFVLVVDDKIESAQELARVADEVAKTERPLLVLAHELGADALALLTVNSLNGRLQGIAVQAPAYGEMRRTILEDVAALTGGLVLGNDAGTTAARAELSQLGTAREVVVGRKTTTIVAHEATPDAGRVRLLEADVRDAGNVYERDELERRRAQLTGRRFAIVKVGAQTDSESQERARRSEDGLRAVQAALAGGVVPGGGVALLRAGDDLEPETDDASDRAAVAAVRRALEEPLRVLAANAGLDPSRVVVEVRSHPASWGLDVDARAFGDMTSAGILDPASVLRQALAAASYMASRAFVAEAVVAQPLAGGRLVEAAKEDGPGNLAMR